MKAMTRRRFLGSAAAASGLAQLSWTDERHADADRVHTDAIIYDGHNDMVCRRLDCNGDVVSRNDSYQADVPRCLEGGMTAGTYFCGNFGLDRVDCLLNGLKRQATEQNRFRIVESVAQIRECKRDRVFGAIPGLESGYCLQHDFNVLANLYERGVRSIGLSHGDPKGEHTKYSLQQTTPPVRYCDQSLRRSERREKGLSDFGRECVKVFADLGVVCDLAHSTDAAFFEVVESTPVPVTFNHGNCFSLCPHTRNLTDDQMKALAANGGVMGITLYPPLIDRSQPSFENLLRHFQYAADLIGPEHVGVGTDYDGMGNLAAPIPDVSNLQLLTTGLLSKEFSASEVTGILGANFLRVFSRVWREKEAG